MTMQRIHVWVLKNSTYGDIELVYTTSNFALPFDFDATVDFQHSSFNLSFLFLP
jgi:hypothetical protein